MQKLNKLGNTWRDEVLVGTDEGALKAQSVKRKPELERFQWNELESLVGVSWAPIPSRESSMEVPPSLVVIQVSTDESIPVLHLVERELVPRQVYIQRRSC